MEKFALINEKLKWYKLLFSLLFTALFVTSGWLLNNFDFKIKAVLIIVMFVITAISLLMLAVLLKIRYCLRQLEDYR